MKDVVKKARGRGLRRLACLGWAFEHIVDGACLLPFGPLRGSRRQLGGTDFRSD